MILLTHNWKIREHTVCVKEGRSNCRERVCGLMKEEKGQGERERDFMWNCVGQQTLEWSGYDRLSLFMSPE